MYRHVCQQPYWATNQSIIQRSLGGKNLAESQKGAIWAGFFKCSDVFVIVMPGIMNFINECWGFFSMPLLTAVLFGLLSRWAPAIAPKIVDPIHMVLYGLTKVIPFFNQFHYLYGVFALFVLECAIYAVCIKLSPRQVEREMPDATVMDMTPWKTGKIWAIVGILVVVVMYLIFSPIGIG